MNIRQRWTFSGGPLDGMQVVAATHAPVPEEIAVREHWHAAYDVTYRRIMPPNRVILDEKRPLLLVTFTYSKTSGVGERVAMLEHLVRHREEEIRRLMARLERAGQRVNRLRGQIKAAATRYKKLKSKR